MSNQLDIIIEKCFSGNSLNPSELARLISPANETERTRIRAAARKQRSKYFGNKIFTYGFVYLSTYCRNDCRFCGYRKSSGQALRYRKSTAEVLEAAHRLARQGVNLIDLTMGEDPAIDNPDFITEISSMIKMVADDLKLPIMVSPGVISKEALAKFKAAGADWYACYQETHNKSLFSNLRAGQDYETRWQTKIEALKNGFLVEEGALCGVGESPYDLSASIKAMKELGAKQVRAMGFVPPKESLNDHDGQWTKNGSPESAQEREIDMIAALRLALPDRLIPATLDVEGLAGLKPRLDAGANVITSLVPAEMALAGVAQASLDIDNEARSIKGVRPIVEQQGLCLATADEYKDWLNSQVA